MASWFVGFYSYLGSYKVGVDFGKEVGKKVGKRTFRFYPKFSDVCVIALLVLSIIGFALGLAFDVVQHGKEVWLSVLLAPLGACLRYLLSTLKMQKCKIPLGTLTANVSGAVLLSLTHVINIQAANEACDVNLSICWPTIITFGIGTGFCASLTTISTFMGETHALRPDHPKFAYLYIITTVLICQLLCGIINGVNYSVSLNDELISAVGTTVVTTSN